MTDSIVELIDSQLEEGEPPGGYDYGDPGFPKCGHCGRSWHGLPLTALVAMMHDVHMYFDGYSVATDRSPVVCSGSDFIGPMPDENAILESVYKQTLEFNALDDGSLVASSPNQVLGDEYLRLAERVAGAWGGLLGSWWGSLGSFFLCPVDSLDV